MKEPSTSALFRTCAPYHLKDGLVVTKYGRTAGRKVGRVQNKKLTLSLAMIYKIKDGLLVNPGNFFSFDRSSKPQHCLGVAT